jgi:C4-dicarboxylate transporter DctM subunit
MDLIAYYLLLPLFVFLVLGVPISVSLGLASAFFLYLTDFFELVPRPIPIMTLVTEMYTGVNQFALLALPMFILSGELMNRFNIVDRLIDLARFSIGWVRGGMAHVTIAASTMFAFISGSALATAASIGPIMIPTMIREKYPNDFAGALVAAAAMLGPIIPPSTPMIIVGSQLGISIGGLFAAGILPGLMISFAMMVLVYVRARTSNLGEVHRFEGVPAIARGTFRALPAISVPVVLLVGIIGGVFTPTEAGAVTVAYALLLGTFYFRTASRNKILEALRATAKVTASVLFIIACALVFNRIMTYFQVPQTLVKIMVSISEDPIVLGLIIIAFLLFVGTFMDELSNMIILGPLLMPVCTEVIGMHSIQYGLFLVVGILLGLLTPPLSLLLNVAAPIAKASVARISVVVLPFFFTQVGILVLIAFVPAVSLTVPRLFGFVD